MKGASENTWRAWIAVEPVYDELNRQSDVKFHIDHLCANCKRPRTAHKSRHNANPRRRAVCP